jgi:hypothetical protein
VRASSRRGDGGPLSLALPNSERLLGVFLRLISCQERADQRIISRRQYQSSLNWMSLNTRLGASIGASEKKQHTPATHSRQCGAVARSKAASEYVSGRLAGAWARAGEGGRGYAASACSNANCSHASAIRSNDNCAA